MVGSGDALLRTVSSVSMTGGCAGLQIQVTVSPFHSFAAARKGRERVECPRPRLRARTESSKEWIDDSLSQPPSREEATVERGASIQSVVDQFPGGWTVLVPDGHYFEDLRITKGIKLVAVGQNAVLFGRIFVSTLDLTLDGLTVYPLDSALPALEVSWSWGILVHNFKIVQNEMSRHALRTSDVPSVSVVNSSFVYFVSSVVSDCGVGLSLDRCNNCVIKRSLFRNCLNALSVTECRDLRAVGNHFEANEVAIQSEGNLTGTFYLKRNTFLSNVRFITRTGLGLTAALEAGNVFSREQSLRPDASYLPERVERVFITGTCQGRAASESGELRACTHVQGQYVCLGVLSLPTLAIGSGVTS